MWPLACFQFSGQDFTNLGLEKVINYSFYFCITVPDLISDINCNKNNKVEECP